MLDASDIDRFVGDRIRRRRVLMGLTQDQLGEALNISYQQIQKYETGANRVSAGRLYLIAKTLQTSPGWFFDGMDDGSDDQDLESLASSSRVVIECVRNLSRITDESVRSSILQLVRSLADSADIETDGKSAPSSIPAEPPIRPRPELRAKS